jgi:hypothetical protein
MRDGRRCARRLTRHAPPALPARVPGRPRRPGGGAGRAAALVADGLRVGTVLAARRPRLVRLAAGAEDARVDALVVKTVPVEGPVARSTTVCTARRRPGPSQARH